MNSGVVVIGRNEGPRLPVCLESVLRGKSPVVYVDSGSDDDSVATARSLNVDVLELEPASPFSAARARNEGFAYLLARHPGIEWVQFIDGDCELMPDWLSVGAGILAARSDLAIVAGTLHERFPQASVYNRLGDLEWNFAGAGETDSVGGIFMVRCEAFAGAGGFDLSVPAGEEPELCKRLRVGGWHLLRVEQRMAKHDLAMTRFAQWWKRQVRTGRGGLDVANRFGLPEFRRITSRARFWSAWPLMVIGTGLFALQVMALREAAIAGLVVFALWPAQFCRIALRTWRNGQPLDVAAAYAFFTMISFWPQMIGQLTYWNDRLSRRDVGLLAHKVSDRRGRE